MKRLTRNQIIFGLKVCGVIAFISIFVAVAIILTKKKNSDEQPLVNPVVNPAGNPEGNPVGNPAGNSNEQPAGNPNENPDESPVSYVYIVNNGNGTTLHCDTNSRVSTCCNQYTIYTSWKIEKVSDGVYYIINKSSGKKMFVADNKLYASSSSGENNKFNITFINSTICIIENNGLRLQSNGGEVSMASNTIDDNTVKWTILDGTTTTSMNTPFRNSVCKYINQNTCNGRPLYLIKKAISTGDVDKTYLSVGCNYICLLPEYRISRDKQARDTCLVWLEQSKSDSANAYNIISNYSKKPIFVANGEIGLIPRIVRMFVYGNSSPDYNNKNHMINFVFLYTSDNFNHFKIKVSNGTLTLYLKEEKVARTVDKLFDTNEPTYLVGDEDINNATIFKLIKN